MGSPTFYVANPPPAPALLHLKTLCLLNKSEAPTSRPTAEPKILELIFLKVF
jgi:hypothetical protein